MLLILFTDPGGTALQAGAQGYLLVQPDRIGLLDWAASLLTDMPQDDVPALYDEKDWQSWAMALYNCPTVARTNPPDPTAYGDWRSWAVQFYGFISGQQPPQ